MRDLPKDDKSCWFVLDSNAYKVETCTCAFRYGSQPCHHPSCGTPLPCKAAISDHCIDNLTHHCCFRCLYLQTFMPFYAHCMGARESRQHHKLHATSSLSCKTGNTEMCCAACSKLAAEGNDQGPLDSDKFCLQQLRSSMQHCSESTMVADPSEKTHVS